MTSTVNSFAESQRHDLYFECSIIILRAQLSTASERELRESVCAGVEGGQLARNDQLPALEPSQRHYRQAA